MAEDVKIVNYVIECFRRRGVQKGVKEIMPIYWINLRP